MVQSKCRLVANQNQTQNLTNNLKFEILFWNAGGMNNAKLLEFQNEIEEKKPDLFVIIDAGSMSENLDKLKNHFLNYQLKRKKRDRVISSGMIAGVKKELICNFRIVKEMSNADRMEAIHIDVWKNNEKFPCTAIYNPPNNKANFDLLPTEQNCILFGDFNSPSQGWNYKTTSTIGKHTEDFIDVSPFNVINTSSRNDFTHLSPNASTTNPDLILAHSKHKQKCFSKINQAVWFTWP